MQKPNEMDTHTLNRIAAALTGGTPLAYALKADGLLVVIDAQGKKQRFAPDAYQHLTGSAGKHTSAQKGERHD